MCTENGRDKENGSSNCNCLTPCSGHFNGENHLYYDQKLALIKWLMILVTTGRFIPEFFLRVWRDVGNEDPRPRAGKIKRMIGIAEWLDSKKGTMIFIGICAIASTAVASAVIALSTPRSVGLFIGIILWPVMTFGGSVECQILFRNFIDRSCNENILAFVVWLWKFSRLTNLSLDQLVQLSEAGFRQVADSVVSQLVRDAQEKQRIMWNLGGLKEDGQIYVQAGTATINAWRFAVMAYVLFKPFGIRQQVVLEKIMLSQTS